MSMVYRGRCAGSAIAFEDRRAIRVGAADWLALASTPTFTVMALLTAVLRGSAPDVLCSAVHQASPLGGMVPMYLLMSAFHLAPWLKLIVGRRRPL